MNDDADDEMGRIRRVESKWSPRFALWLSRLRWLPGVDCDRLCNGDEDFDDLCNDQHYCDDLCNDEDECDDCKDHDNLLTMTIMNMMKMTMGMIWTLRMMTIVMTT